VSEQLESRASRSSTSSAISARARRSSACISATSGGLLNFRETFIDNGSVLDMLKAMRVYREVGYDSMMMPDHVPQVEGVDSQQAFAFAFGYIKALIAAVAAER
jgi:D-mannonate dehydratase